MLDYKPGVECLSVVSAGVIWTVQAESDWSKAINSSDGSHTLIRVMSHVSAELGGNLNTVQASPF